MCRSTLSLLGTLRHRDKQISILELLWAVLALIVWRRILQGAFVILFEDNTAAQYGIRKGMSRHTDINIFRAACGALRPSPKPTPGLIVLHPQTTRLTA